MPSARCWARSATAAGRAAAKPAQAAPAPAAQAPAAKAAPPPPPKAAPRARRRATNPTARCRPAPRRARSWPRRASTPADVAGSGRRGQILKEDVLAAPAAKARRAGACAARGRGAGRRRASGFASHGSVPVPVPAQNLRAPSAANDAAREERVRMTRLRQTIAQRLKDAQNTAAMLTTFNDVDMSAVMKLRSEYKDAVREAPRREARLHGLLREGLHPGAEGDPGGQRRDRRRRHRLQELLPHRRRRRHRPGPGRAGGARGRPHVRSPRSRAQITDYGKRARDGKLGIDDMQGGTFTITNGGVYGSLLSTPILNAPQSGILGMHRIEERPVVRDGQVVARPMMYLALELRPPHRRRQGGGDLPGARQGVPRRPAAVSAGALSLGMACGACSMAEEDIPAAIEVYLTVREWRWKPSTSTSRRSARKVAYQELTADRQQRSCTLARGLRRALHAVGLLP